MFIIISIQKIFPPVFFKVLVGMYSDVIHFKLEIYSTFKWTNFGGAHIQTEADIE